MSINREREVTNKSFKAKMSEILSVLSGETYTPVPTANDNETLNCKTFEYFMNELKKHVGGGAGNNDFIISATLTMDGSPSISSETTISDIIAANTAGKNIKLEITSPTMDLYIGYIIYLIGVDGNDPEAGFLIYLDDFGKVVCNKNGWAIG